MIELNKDIKYIKGVGPARAELLNKVGIYTLEDAITYFPRGHEDRGNVKRKVVGSKGLPCRASSARKPGKNHGGTCFFC